MSKLQKILTLVITGVAVLTIGYSVYCHFAKASDLIETNQSLASAMKYIQRVDLQSEIKFILFQMDRLEDDYRNKPKDLYYHDKKRTLERLLNEANEKLKQMKGN